MSQLVQQTDDDWTRWERICDYTGWDPHGLLKPMRYHGHVIPYSAELGVGPVFFNELQQRINKVKPIRMAIVGEAGSGKTYTAIHIAQLLDPKFKIDQVVLYGKDYIKLQRVLPPRRCIVLEEPTFHLAARTWQSQWQRIIVSVIESTRFQNNPLLIPVVNRNLVDKTVREYYLNYVIEMFDRGIARVYRVRHSQWYDRLTRTTGFNLYMYGPGMLIADCGRDTCLECPELAKCERSIYPYYERKREEAIRYYQEQGERDLKMTEAQQAKQLTFQEIYQKAADNRQDYLTADGTDYMVQEIMRHFNMGHSKAQDIKHLLLKHYPVGAENA